MYCIKYKKLIHTCTTDKVESLLFSKDLFFGILYSASDSVSSFLTDDVSLLTIVISFDEYEGMECNSADNFEIYVKKFRKVNCMIYD